MWLEESSRLRQTIRALSRALGVDHRPIARADPPAFGSLRLPVQRLWRRSGAADKGGACRAGGSLAAVGRLPFAGQSSVALLVDWVALGKGGDVFLLT